MTTPTDAQLLVDSVDDPAAFRELYDRYADRVNAFLCRQTRDPESAYDLTAETFAQAWLARARFRDEANGSAGPWLFAIARNKLLMSVRRSTVEARARERLGVLLPPAATPAAEPEPAWLEGLEQALSELPAGQREVLRLRVEDDLAYDEVAAALGTTSQAARVRVHRAIASLRRRLPNPKETIW